MLSTDYEDLLRQTSLQRGWVVRVEKNLITLSGVPYRKKNGDAGSCNISVATEDDQLTMKAPENSGEAIHAAILTGVEGGRAYSKTSEPVGNVLWSDDETSCVISIITDEGAYQNAWHALTIYAVFVTAEVGQEQRQNSASVFHFSVEGESDLDSENWRVRARDQRIGIVGLGGVGLWIFDLMSKTDVRKIEVWDEDKIEGRNLLRAPGWASSDAIGEKKASYFGSQYERVRQGISIHEENLSVELQPSVFTELDFVFIAVDKAETRTALCEALEEANVPFVDVGMGLERREGRVRGSFQVFYSGSKPDRWRVGIPTVEGNGQDEYRALQLAELGALNASFAVGVWRRHIGQYEGTSIDWLVRYLVEDNEILKRSESS